MIDPRSSLTRPKRRSPAPEKPAPVAPEKSPEQTVIYDAARSRSAPALLSPHFLVIAGPRKGMEIPLGAGVTTIGRGEENTVVIPDISVSRQHVSLTREHQRFVLHDQGSGNGTLVNGRPIERHLLAHFDEVVMGDTRVRFVEPGAAQPAPAVEAQRKRSWRIPLLIAVLLVPAGGLLALRRTQQRRRAALALFRVEQTKALAQRWFQEGSALGKEDKWAEALDKLKTAAELDGQDVELRRAVEEAETELARPKPEAAPAIAPPQPEPPKVALPRRPAQQAPPVEQPPDMQKVLAAYLAGDLASAIEQAARSLGPRGPPLLEQLRRFEAARRDGLALVEEQKPVEALQALTQAQAYDRSISQGKAGRPGRELRKTISLVHTQLAAEWAGNDEGLPSAADQLRSALREDPSNEPAAKALKQIADRCQELYLRGYVSKDDDVATARAAFKLVVATLPAGDALAQKSQLRLDKLDGRSAEPRSIGDE
jgi:pSer/pThr/pTyr-binding forkhead associated (FHA) protein